MTEDSRAVGEPSQSEDGEYEQTSLSVPSEEQSMGKMEALDNKQEVASAAKPQRRASTPPAANLPVKLLTRLGSLEGELVGRLGQTALVL